MKTPFVALLIGSASMASAQIPDLLNSLDAGSPSLGAGSAFTPIAADTFSGYFNPAGLGYLAKRQVGLAYRNLPETRGLVAGNLANLSWQGNIEKGSSRISHLGFAAPMSQLFGRGSGTLGLSYTIGGYIDDRSVAAPNQIIPFGGGLGIAGYAEETRSQTDYYTLAWGRTNASQTLAYGIGLHLVNQRSSFKQTGTVVDGQGQPQNPALSPLLDLSSTGTGVGAVLGVQYIPISQVNLSFGLSVQTPISVSGGDSGALVSRIPGRILGGTALRLGGFRKNSQDYSVIGVQFVQYFGGSNTQLFPRGSYGGAGIGYEYVLVSSGRSIPLRVGYSTISNGGGGFDRRAGLTYGIGLRLNDRYFIDANYARPNNAPADFVLTFGYRF